ncbi:AMP-binding protein [Sciscionella sediminilitoris]|uniref:AMP-binding protein n=1 Tax=Sciscionella sediminilitoris TaxID=1445613 RepID=UPI0004DF3F15|nr:AMP-binding protein [Sciscionella sp. SE31]
MTPEDFHDRIEKRALDSAAPVTFSGNTGSWSELFHAAHEIADWLSAAGVRRGDVVAIVADADSGTAASILATWKLGATVSVLAGPSSTKRAGLGYPEWLRLRLGQLRARALVTTIGELDTGWRATESGPLGMRALRNPVDTEQFPDPPVILQLTSGSTGTPKMVPVSAESAIANVEATARHLGLTGEDSVVSWLPLNHDMGLIGTFVLPALHGLPLRLSTPDSFVRSPMSWLTDLAQTRATLTFAPHFAYALLARYGRIRTPEEDIDLSALRHCLNGSEPINAAEFAAFGEFAARFGMPETALRPGYGMAELGLVFSTVVPGEPMRSVTADPNSLVSGGIPREDPEGSTVTGCGKPLPGYSADIRDEHGESLPPGSVGEICVHGPSLFPGYLGRQDHDYFWADGHYRTGDLGFLRDGEVFVCGRISDVIIVRGENFVPQDIEHEVAGLDEVRSGNVAAFGVTDSGAESVVVVAETNKPSEELRGRIARRVREAIAVRPADVVLLGTGQLPKTTSGKLQRQQCKRSYLEGAWSK